MNDPTEALRSDPFLGPIVEEEEPVTVAAASDPFERLLVSILRQQVSMEAAAAIEGRLFDRVEPTPADIRKADPETMREAGLSTAKVEYVKALAETWADRDWSESYFADKPDETVVEELTNVRGVGPWTAKMFLLFGLGRADVFPVEDLGIRTAMKQVIGEDLSRAEMVETAARWQPYRSYASQYLWRTID
ncbi:DNA-3-methyladenine glycosylase family protein [Halanaeroarchaeum sulfurireducens]|nr:DNA-3-methyladenine glycosylase [Halanaeroarchaeum sulfurireducens]